MRTWRYSTLPPPSIWFATSPPMSDTPPPSLLFFLVFIIFLIFITKGLYLGSHIFRLYSLTQFMNILLAWLSFKRDPNGGRFCLLLVFIRSGSKDKTKRECDDSYGQIQQSPYESHPTYFLPLDFFAFLWRRVRERRRRPPCWSCCCCSC